MNIIRSMAGPITTTNVPFVMKLPIPPMPDCVVTSTSDPIEVPKKKEKRTEEKPKERFVPMVEKRGFPPLKIEETKPSGSQSSWKRVIQVLSNEKNPKQWEVIGEYPSITEAAKSVGAPSAANIFHCIDKGKIYQDKYKFVSKNF